VPFCSDLVIETHSTKVLSNSRRVGAGLSFFFRFPACAPVRVLPNPQPGAQRGPRSGSDPFRLAAVWRSGRAIVFLALVLELVGKARTSWAFENSHPMAARRVLLVTNCRMVSGRIITRAPTLTYSILRAWIQSRKVLTEMPSKCAARLTSSKGSMGSRGRAEGIDSCHDEPPFVRSPGPVGN
jgi:hypothetical protein